MKKKLFFSLVATIIFAYWFSFLPQLAKADDYCQSNCELNKSSATNYQQCLQNKKNCLEKKLDGIRSKKLTLTNEISLINGKINLQRIKIKQTLAEIDQLEAEISTLGDQIQNLNLSLDRLTDMLLERVRARYKRSRFSPLILILNTKSLENFLIRQRYLEEASKQTAEIMQKAETQRLLFDQQKQKKEEVQQELENKKQKLEKQRRQLANQRYGQQKLLSETRNSEVVYQRLLAQAKAQLAAFSSFVKSSGADSIIAANAFGSGSDGAYFSQRDSRWGYQTIGNSSENILNVGCLLTSVAMVLKKNGINVNPSIIAANPKYFSVNTAYMYFRNRFNPWFGKLNNYRISTRQIDEELNRGHYVIAGINYGRCKKNADHFVVLIRKQGSDYIMHDPLYGPDLKFSSHYSQVCKAEVFR